ncbi:hypothetical protein ACIHFC_36995 [Streptomyces sp. NPDC052013]|uniref:hypothetical protein n=1 Tax=Streptomyces sp. NPDC052013 TaxID=3365679 RepID=UPI0037D17F2E
MVPYLRQRVQGTARRGILGVVESLPVVVHEPSRPSGGRRVTRRRGGREETLGFAYSDHDLVVFLEAAGVADPEAALNDPACVQWRGGQAHQWTS